MKCCSCLWASMLVLALGLSPVSAFSKDIRFVSFNTFWLFDDQPPHAKWWEKNRKAMGQTYNQALTLVAEAIKKTNGDVVALQEIENQDVLDALNVKLSELSVTYPYSWISNGSDRPTGQDVAILSKYPKAQNGLLVRDYKRQRETYLTENDPGNEKDTGLSKALRVDLDIDNKTVPVFVFHLKSQLGGNEADQQRLAQASLVRRITLPLIVNNATFIVMGDMNADRGSPTLRRIRGFDDIYADLVQPIYSDKFTGDRWTYKYIGRTQQIDHILLSPNLRKSLISGSVHYGHDKATSDHFPVILNVRF